MTGFIINPYVFPPSIFPYVLNTGTIEIGFNSNVHSVGNQLLTGNVIIGKTLTKITLSLKGITRGSEVITVGIYTQSGTLLFTFGTINANTLTTSFADYIFENLTGYTVSVNELICVNGTTGANNYTILYNGNIATWDLGFQAFSSGSNFNIGNFVTLNMTIN